MVVLKRTGKEPLTFEGEELVRVALGNELYRTTVAAYRTKDRFVLYEEVNSSYGLPFNTYRADIFNTLDELVGYLEKYHPIVVSDIAKKLGVVEYLHKMGDQTSPIVLKRSGRRPLAFGGEELARVKTGNKTTAVYRAKDRFILYEEFVSPFSPLFDNYEVRVFATPNKLVGYLEKNNPGVAPDVAEKLRVAGYL